MLQPADLLVLDEPTNDLDIPTLEVLEESLLDFPGALVLVSHDRQLIDRVTTEILALDGRGGARRYADYDQWMSSRQAAKSAKSPKSASLREGRRRRQSPRGRAPTPAGLPGTAGARRSGGEDPGGRRTGERSPGLAGESLDRRECRFASRALPRLSRMPGRKWIDSTSAGPSWARRGAEPAGTGGEVQAQVSWAPQYLQYRASMACPSLPHSVQAWVWVASFRLAAISTETIPVGTAMMP